MEKRIKIEFPLAVLATLGVFFLFSEMYIKLIVPTYNWGGMSHSPRDKYFFELALVVLTAFFLPNKINAPSDFYNWLYFILLLIPASVLSLQQGSDRFYLFLMFSALWLLMLFKSIFTQIRSTTIILKPFNKRSFPYKSVFIFVIAILFFLVISVGGAFNLNFIQVYEYRFSISENMPIALQYMLPWASSTFIGYLSALSIWKRNIKGLLLTIILGVLFFGYSSHKSMLFNPIIATASYFLLKSLRPHLIVIMCFLSLAFIALALPEDTFRFPMSLFANRIVFLPSQINFFYFEFFSKNPFMMWAESKISMGLIDSALPMAVMNYIGGLMTGNYDMVANTGWVANAYMNAGVFGLVLYSFIIGGIYSLIDYWAAIYGKQFVGAAFLIPINTLIMSADLMIVLLTSGLILLLTAFIILSLPKLRFSIHKDTSRIKASTNLNLKMQP